MDRRLGGLIAVVTLTSGVLLVGSVSLGVIGPVSPEGVGPVGTIAAISFWVSITLVCSSLAVRMPGGLLVDVGFAPILAAMSIGGPAMAAWTGLFGTTQIRELRREVPWYGVLANHCGIGGPAMIGAFVIEAVPGRSDPTVDFAATALGGLAFFCLNAVVSGGFTSLRTGEHLMSPLRSMGGAYVNLIALVPVAWLMAQMYLRAGFWAVLLFAVPLYTTRVAYQRFVEVREMFTQTVASLAEAVDKRDTFTSGHSHRVQAIAMDIGRAMKVREDELEALEWGGLLHDIGKIGVPDAVLLKQGFLTRDERATMNAHPVLGAEIIAPVRKLAPELPIIRHHHEWFNGSGYPDRLMGDEIPKLARILHVADAFEAMTAARPYRMTPLTPEQALGELRKFGGIQFDPDIVDAFVRTKWARQLPDPGRQEPREVPLIGQAAAAIAAAAAPEGAGSPPVSPSVAPEVVRPQPGIA